MLSLIYEKAEIIDKNVAGGTIYYTVKLKDADARRLSKMTDIKPA